MLVDTHEIWARTLGRWPEKSGLRHDRSRKLNGGVRIREAMGPVTRTPG